MDHRDLGSIIVMLGEDIKGGSTTYFSGQNAKKPGDRILEVPHKHLRYQVC